MFKSLYLNSTKLYSLRMYVLIMAIKIKMLNCTSRLSLNMVFCVAPNTSNLVNNHSEGENIGLVNGFNLFLNLNGC